MDFPLHGRSFLRELDFTNDEWAYFINLASELKTAKRNGTEQQYLRGLNIALVFEKMSTRTRCAFEVAAADQGAHTTYLDPSGSHLGYKESVADTARVLGRMYDGIEYRGDSQCTVEELAHLSGVPVFNGLTDLWHPTQMLADALTMKEHSDKPLNETSFAYLGDARFNMGRSLIVSGAMLGMRVVIVAPQEFQPPSDVVSEAEQRARESGAEIIVTDEIEAVRDIDFIHTDMWVSMGEDEAVWDERVRTLLPYRVTEELMEQAGERAHFMHCLPAVHDNMTTVGQRVFDRYGLIGAEVANRVFEGPRSIVFDQAENRLHTIKAVMVALLGR
ncbi:MAG: ornithine carbamoyltransferase [Actinomycetaceae bacterium]|nr:ornithine carbamoyltransferase [Actinomycetaceae bacterium]